MTTLKIVTIAAVLLVGDASLAMAQYGGWYPGHGYAAAPLYDYAAPLTATQLQLMRHRLQQERPLLS